MVRMTDTINKNDNYPNGYNKTIKCTVVPTLASEYELKVLQIPWNEPLATSNSCPEKESLGRSGKHVDSTEHVLPGTLKGITLRCSPHGPAAPGPHARKRVISPSLHFQELSAPSLPIIQWLFLELNLSSIRKLLKAFSAHFSPNWTL